MDSALADFWHFVKDFGDIKALITKAAILAPLSAIVLPIGSPWPTEITASILACIVEVVAILLAYEFWRRGRPRIAYVRKWLLLFSIAFFALLGVYMSITTQYVTIQDPNHRIVKGYEYKPEIVLRYGSEPFWPPDNELMIKYNGPSGVWTANSLHIMRTLVLGLWLGLWGSLAATISAFLALQWLRKPYTKQPKSGAANEPNGT